MMEKKKLDRLFQEKFRDFEEMPPEQVWSDLEAKLRQKKKRRIIPFWYQVSGVAALLVLGLVIWQTLDTGSVKVPDAVVEQNPQPEQDSTFTNPDAVAVENQSSEASESTEGVSSEPKNEKTGNQMKPVSGSQLVQTEAQRARSSKGSETRVASRGRNESEGRNESGVPGASNLNASGVRGESVSTNERSAVAQTDAPSDKKETTPDAIANRETQSGNRKELENTSDPSAQKPLTINPATELAVVQAPTAEPQPDSTAIATVEPNALEELLHEKENKVTADGQKINRWQVTSSVAPIYFSSASNGSPVDSRFESNNKTYKPSVSYGVGAQYAISKRLSVRSGVNSVALEYSTNDLMFYQTPDATPLANIKTNAQGSIIQIEPNTGPMTLAARSMGKRTFEGVLNQRTSYIEVPVEMSYKLIDRQFGINLIGGFSSLFLNENRISLESENMNMTIGEAENLNDLHFSTNLGIGFSYRFLKAFEANFNPMFKYQINTFSDNSGNFKPYFFGLYTGVSYRF